VLKHGADYVIRGEGEVALPRLLTEFAKAQPITGALKIYPGAAGTDKSVTIQSILSGT
jgi:hypothetical protein